MVDAFCGKAEITRAFRPEPKSCPVLQAFFYQAAIVSTANSAELLTALNHRYHLGCACMMYYTYGIPMAACYQDTW